MTGRTRINLKTWHIVLGPASVPISLGGNFLVTHDTPFSDSTS